MGGCEVCHRLSVCVRFFRKMAKMYKMNFIARNELLEKAMTGSQLELPIFIELASWLYLISGPRKLFYGGGEGWGGGVLPAKTCNKDHSFYNTILLKKPHLTNLISLNNAKNILLQHSKNFHSFYQFSSK